MKKLLSILIVAFFLSNIVTYAQKENNPFTEIALIQAKRKNPTSKGDTPISRSIIKTANATYIIIQYASTSTRHCPLPPSPSSTNRPVKTSIQKHTMLQQISAST